MCITPLTEEKPVLSIRRARKEDMRFAWEVRNHPDIRRNMFDEEEIPWEHHISYYKKTLWHENIFYYIIQIGDMPIGILKFTTGENEADTSIMILPQYQGCGYGTAALKIGMRLLPKNIPLVVGRVKTGNFKSMAMFERAGFTLRSINSEEVEYNFHPDTPA